MDIGKKIRLKKVNILKKNEIITGKIINHETDEDIMGMICKDEYTILLDCGKQIKVDNHIGGFNRYKIMGLV